MHGLVLEVFLDEFGGVAIALEEPGKDISKFVVVTKRLAVRGLVLHAEVSTARFLAGQGVEAHQFAKFEKVGHAACTFE